MQNIGRRCKASLLSYLIQIWLSISKVVIGNIETKQSKVNKSESHLKQRGAVIGRDRMVVGFTTTYAICACHH
jgi:hypothetical protein